MSDTSLVSLRLQLADARSALRLRQDIYNARKMKVELGLIASHKDDPKALGTNETDRKRTFEAAVTSDGGCTEALIELRDAQYEVDRLAAMVDGALDERRDRELTIREREGYRS